MTIRVVRTKIAFHWVQLEEAAVRRWGSLEDLEEERHKRVERKEKKALEKAEDAEKGVLVVDGDVCWYMQHSLYLLSHVFRCADDEELAMQNGEEQPAVSQTIAEGGAPLDQIQKRKIDICCCRTALHRSVSVQKCGIACMTLL